MFRPPFLARVAAGAAVYVLEETRRLPSAAVKFPVTAVSQLLQAGMHAQQFVTSLAIKGDSVFDRIVNRPEERPEWATFDEDDELPVRRPGGAAPARDSGFDRFDSDPAEVELALQETLAGLRAMQNGSAVPEATTFETEEWEKRVATEPAPETGTSVPDPEPATTAPAPEATSAATPEAGDTGEAEATTDPEPADTAEPGLPEVGARYDYPNMTLAQLRGRLRTLTVADLVALLDYEQRTRDRAAFVTMLTNRIATVRAQ
ncbi:lipid droplet-associated protein [Nocardia flavorosea]|uniref:Lipid droplet-associated protein n=1 Tax=Nocardia flavorosea TaxID=53429 RepID=A0A846YEG5_9NOCA|nr:lipid droplet-associated protein [Nocardia flavorosea]NKY55558.1 lipid droplet-associated protein [Nocardia flavorosea]